MLRLFEMAIKDPIRPGGGAILPPPLTFERLSIKNCLSPDRRAERVFKFAGQEMLCKFWTYLHFFRNIIDILSC